MGRLVQGVKLHIRTGSNTIQFIHPSQILSERRTVYLHIVAELKPSKSNLRRVRFTVGGNRINYPGIVTTPTVGNQTTKLHLNSVSCDVNTSYIVADI